MSTLARGSDFNADPGDEVEVDAHIAAQLLNGGYAEALEAAPEAAVEEPAEDAAEEPPRPRPRRKRAKRSKSSE